MKRRDVLTAIAFAPWWPSMASASAVDPWTERRLEGPDGEPSALVEHAAGRRLMVVTMKGHWCPVCLKQLVRLADLWAELRHLHATVAGLNADSPKANAEAAKEMKIPFAILSDPDHRVLDALGLWRSKAAAPMPAIVVFDECGAERGRLVGRRPGDRVESSLLAVLRKIHDKPPSCSGHGNA